MFEDGAHGEFGAREHHQQKRDVSHTFYNVRLLLKPPLLMTINIKGLDPPNSHLFFTPQKKKQNETISCNRNRDPNHYSIFDVLWCLV